MKREQFPRIRPKAVRGQQTYRWTCRHLELSQKNEVFGFNSEWIAMYSIFINDLVCRMFCRRKSC